MTQNCPTAGQTAENAFTICLEEIPSACILGVIDRPLPLPERVLIDQVVSQVFGVGQGELRTVSRGRAHVAQARQVAMYLAHVIGQFSLSDVGRLFGRDRTTVAHACNLVEDLRDDPLFDRVMELLEAVVAAMLSPRMDAQPRCN